MPEGYQCAVCESFSPIRTNISELELNRIVYETGETGSTTFTLCPDCATGIYEFVADVTVPEDAREEHL